MHHTGTWIIHACWQRRGSSPWQHSIHEICGAKGFLCPLSPELPRSQQHPAPPGHIPAKSLCRCRQSTPPSRCSPSCSWWGRWRSPRRRTPSPAARGNRNVINDISVVQWHQQQHPDTGTASVGTPWCHTEPLEHYPGPISLQSIWGLLENETVKGLRGLWPSRRLGARNSNQPSTDNQWRRSESQTLPPPCPALYFWSMFSIKSNKTKLCLLHASSSNLKIQRHWGRYLKASYDLGTRCTFQFLFFI